MESFDVASTETLARRYLTLVAKPSVSLSLSRHPIRSTRSLSTACNRARLLASRVKGSRARGSRMPTGKTQILWTFDGWELVRNLILESLPEWAELRIVDSTKPLGDQVADTEVIIPTTGPLPAQVVEAAPKLQLILQPAAGYSNIPLEAAKARGIPVCNAPGVNARAVAEATIMVLLMLARRAPENQMAFQTGKVGGPLGMQLEGKTLGIIGMGAIGQQVARLGEALGMRCIGLTSKSTRQDLEHLLQTSDAVTLHCPLTPTTRDMIGYRELELMREGAMLINFARGEVIDKQALLKALDSGRLWGVGLDVHWQEPADASEALYQHKNVVALPHSGVGTHEVFESLSALIVENLQRWKAGNELLHRLV